MNRLVGTAPEDVEDAAFNAVERRYLERLSRSRRVGDRKLCLEYVRNSVLVHNNRNFVLGLLDQLAGDKNAGVSDLALFLAGEFIRDHPRKVWPMMVKYGSRQSWLVRQMVAACLLEHLLEFHFDEYFPKIREMVLGGDRGMAYTLSHCYIFGQAEQHEAEIKALTAQARRRARKRRPRPRASQRR